MLTIHHLRLSQSERIVWLAEELGLDYEGKLYTRRTRTASRPTNTRRCTRWASRR